MGNEQRVAENNKVNSRKLKHEPRKEITEFAYALRYEMDFLAETLLPSVTVKDIVFLTGCARFWEILDMPEFYSYKKNLRKTKKISSELSQNFNLPIFSSDSESN